MTGARKHLATRWHISSSAGGGSILRCYCGDWESDPKATTYAQRAAHRAHRVEMGETVAPSRPTVSERLKTAEAALAEATAKLAHLAGVGHLADREIDLASRRLNLLQYEARLRDAAISRVRALHRIHSCEVDGHKLDRTPNPCVNDGFCRCGNRAPCSTLEALDSLKDATDAAL